MSAVRVRTPGNNPETRVFCDGGEYLAGGPPCHSLPVADWDAREARKRAKEFFGWVRVAGKDYCPGCWPSAARSASREDSEKDVDHLHGFDCESCGHAAVSHWQNPGCRSCRCNADPLCWCGSLSSKHRDLRDKSAHRRTA